MATDGRVYDIDKDDSDRWCEYIFYRGLHRTAYARISRGSITDTELQVGQFAVPSYGRTTGDVAEADRYLRCGKEEVPREHVRHFPPASCEPRFLRLLARFCSGSLPRITATRIKVAYGVTFTTSLMRCVCHPPFFFFGVLELTMDILFFFLTAAVFQNPSSCTSRLICLEGWLAGLT